MNPKFFRNGIVMLVLVVGTAALLFTWIQSSGTAPTTVGYSAFLTDVKEGQVTKVTQQGETLTVKPQAATAPTYTVTVPAPIVTKVYDDIVAGGQGAATWRPSRTTAPCPHPTPRGSGCC